MTSDKTYIAIDLKSFYASVECIERGLDPLKTNLVVADRSRTSKTICLAVSPSLKAYGIPGRARLFEAEERVRRENAERKLIFGKELVGSSCNSDELSNNPSLAVDFIAATPRMAHYIEYSTRIYDVYLRYVAPEDIHVYSIDEVFLDVSSYLRIQRIKARDFAAIIIKDIISETGITATAGIGSNLYLAKVAMDIVAKKIPADENGVRIAELDEASYRRELWAHRPLTDFWRVGRAYSEKLEARGIYTMGDIARCSLGKPEDFYSEDMLYKLFGVNAELLIDHAWGYEPCTMEHIKSYRPESNSISSGQVMSEPCDAERTKLVVREMADLLSLDLVERGLITDQIVLTVGYDTESLRSDYSGEVTTDFYGRQVPKHAHGTENLKSPCSSAKKIVDAVMRLFDRIFDKTLLSRRINITAAHLTKEDEAKSSEAYQLNLFSSADDECETAENELLARERRMQKAMIDIKKKHGKNAIIKGMNLEEGATAIERNKQIGGHKA